MEVVIGNLLDVTHGVIGHQTNCIGVAGAGVARSIAQNYPEWKDTYIEVCRSYNIHELIGKLHLYNATPTLTIASLYGQRTTGKGVMTEYDALSRALKKLYERTPPTTPIYLPYGIGCGLAGGDWGTVQLLIEKCCPSTILVRLK
jgi:O-acetyl-ADP-ribose deacetylase (regulator of RNase III)